MTTTDDRPPTIAHPTWCNPGLWCTTYNDENVSSYVWGDHIAPLHGFQTIWGSRIELNAIQCGQELVNRGAGAALRVSMVIPAHEDDVPEDVRDTVREDAWRREHGERTDLEPEEARMLARFLIESADQVERMRS